MIHMELKNFLIPDGNNYNQRKLVHQLGGVSRTLMGLGHAGNEPKVIVRCVAMRGRPTLDGGVQQQLELRGEFTNAITTVTKDNLILERAIHNDGGCFGQGLASIREDPSEPGSIF